MAKWIVFSVSVMMVACGSDKRGTAVDSGSPDTGRPDTGPIVRRDSGPTDMCFATGMNAIASLGCNGPPNGAGVADNSFGGSCVPDAMNPAGSYIGAGAICAGDPMGICLATCPAAGSYVSTGGCPAGGRCFNLGMGGVCFPDCNTPADCVSGSCDGEGSCVPAAPPDGGMGDAAVDAATSDAGTSDAGTSDAAIDALP